MLPLLLLSLLLTSLVFGQSQRAYETELTADKLAGLLADFAEQRKMLEEMACRARELALPDAARRVAALCMQAAGMDTRALPEEPGA